MTPEHTSLNSSRKPNTMSNHDVSKVSRCQRGTSWFVVPLSSARGLPAWLLFCVHFFFLCVPPHDRIPDCQYETRVPQCQCSDGPLSAVLCYALTVSRRSSCLVRRSSGAWSWCASSPTTHTRGWCRAYRDTSAQTRRKDT